MARQLLSEAEGYELLKSAGIPVPQFVVARSSAEAANAAGTIGYPVVMKVISPQVVHKSDAGGVIFGLIVAILLFLAPTPPGFALALGIISGVVAFFVLDDRKKVQ